MPIHQERNRKHSQNPAHLAGKGAKASTEVQGSSEVMNLQRTIGNRAVANMLVSQETHSPVTIQTKMTVGPIGDSYEQEADKVGKLVADKISASEPSSSQPIQRASDEEELQMKPAAETIQRASDEEELQMKPAAETIQRASDEEELQMKPAAETIQRASDEEELQMKPAAETIQRASDEEELQLKPAAETIQRASDEEELQMKPSADGGFEPGASIENQIKEKQGSGSKMDNQIRAKMESAFGADFSDVNIHADARSDQLSQSVGALAFATGNDIFFRQGQYNPGNRQGQELLGHELTHVVQQNGAKSPS